MHLCLYNTDSYALNPCACIVEGSSLWIFEPVVVWVLVPELGHALELEPAYEPAMYTLLLEVAGNVALVAWDLLTMVVKDWLNDMQMNNWLYISVSSCWCFRPPICQCHHISIPKFTLLTRLIHNPTELRVSFFKFDVIVRINDIHDHFKIIIEHRLHEMIGIGKTRNT